ncbi:MAG: Holliday junction resolvase RuvX [Chloroflexi bacterium]|nr:Holliday junction resolvase RuvX [Chloroflexota bacterium]
MSDPSPTRYLAVDPGEKYLGLAVSDPTGRLARPLRVLRHRSQREDAAAIAQVAREVGAGVIVVGVATDVDGQPTTLQARRARNLARHLRRVSGLPVVLWDETGTTQAARAVWAQTRRRRRAQERPDAAAAALLLQSYLNAQHPPPEPDLPPPEDVPWP